MLHLKWCSCPSTLTSVEKLPCWFVLFCFSSLLFYPSCLLFSFTGSFKSHKKASGIWSPFSINVYVKTKQALKTFQTNHCWVPGYNTKGQQLNVCPKVSFINDELRLSSYFKLKTTLFDLSRIYFNWNFFFHSNVINFKKWRWKLTNDVPTHQGEPWKIQLCLLVENDYNHWKMKGVSGVVSYARL